MERLYVRGYLAPGFLAVQCATFVYDTVSHDRHDGSTEAFEGREISPLRLALYQPDIPQNAGTLLRLCACLGVAVDIVEPAGFPVSDRAFRRAGLDYLDQVEIVRHVSFAAFDQARRAARRRLVLLTTRGSLSHLSAAFEADDVLMLGRESVGVPDDVHATADLRVAAPMRPGFRSLNVAVAGAIVLGEALRQTNGFPSFAARP